FCFPHSPPPPSHTSTLSLHDALPISSIAMPATSSCARYELLSAPVTPCCSVPIWRKPSSCSFSLMTIRQARSCSSTAFSKSVPRSEEHTSELQSRRDLVCRLLLEKKK